MSQSIGFSDTMGSNEFVAANPDVNASEFNPLQQNSRVSLFASATLTPVAGRGLMVTVKIGSRILCSDLVIPQPIASTSTRDHLVATGIGLKGEKITLTYRNEGTAATVFTGVFVIE